MFLATRPISVHLIPTSHRDFPHLHNKTSRIYIQMPSPQLKDPWARKEAWRYQGPFTRANRFKGTLPGLGLGIGAFVAFSAFEYFTEKKH